VTDGATRTRGVGPNQSITVGPNGVVILKHGRSDPLCAAFAVAICADLVRPSTTWFVAAVPRGGALVRGMTLARDPAGFARLRQQCEQDAHLPAAAGTHTLHRAAVVLGAKGGVLAEVTVGDVLELLDVETTFHRSPMGHATAFYRTLHQLGIFEVDAPTRLREVRSAGQHTPAELIDRFDLACRPVRDLLVDYLCERQPALDYSSLRALAADLGNVFWKDLERHHPGIASLHLPAEVATTWKQRLRTRPKTVTAAAGEKTTLTVEPPRSGLSGSCGFVGIVVHDRYQNYYNAQWTRLRPVRGVM